MNLRIPGRVNQVVALLWLIVGVVVAILVARDIARTTASDWTLSLVAAALPWILFTCGCFFFSYGVFRPYRHARTIGILVSLLASLGAAAYLLLNILYLFATGNPKLTLPAMAGLIALLFSMLSFVVARGLQPNPTIERDAPKAARPSL
jgi:hypothetical protein